MPIARGFGAATKRPSNEAFTARSSSAADLKHLNRESKEWKTARSIDQLSDSSDSHSMTSSGGHGRLLRDFSVEHIPTRLTNQTGPKLAYNPMQFVKTGPAVQLSQTAREQIEKAKELKKLREVKKDDAEEWQANLEGWKRSRLRRQENVIERVKDVKRFEEEDAWKQAEDAVQRNKIKRALRDNQDGHTSSYLSRYSEDVDTSENGTGAKPLNSSLYDESKVHQEGLLDDSKDLLHNSSQSSSSTSSMNAEPADLYSEPPVKPVAAPRRSLTPSEPVAPVPRRRSIKDAVEIKKEEKPAEENNGENIFPLKGAVTQRRSFFEPLPASSDDIQPFDTNRKPREFRHGLRNAADRSSTPADKEAVELSLDAQRVPAADILKNTSGRAVVRTDTMDRGRSRVPEPETAGTQVPDFMEQEKESKKSVPSLRIPRGSSFTKDRTTDKEPVRVPDQQAAGTKVPGIMELDKTYSESNSPSLGTPEVSSSGNDSEPDITDKVPELPKTQVPKSMERDWDFSGIILPASKVPDTKINFKDLRTDFTDIPDRKSSNSSVLQPDHLNASLTATSETSETPDKKTVSALSVTDTVEKNYVHPPKSALNQMEDNHPDSGMLNEFKLKYPGKLSVAVEESADSDWTEDEGIRSLSPEAIVKPVSIRMESTPDPAGKSHSRDQESTNQAFVNPEPMCMEALVTPGNSETTEMGFDWLVGVAPKLAPPSEKPPPPPSFSELDEYSTPAVSSPFIKPSELSTNKEEIKLRDADTVRNIRSELRKRRSDFLGFEVPTEELSDVTPVPPPPDLKSIILQTDLRPSELKMFADQPLSVRDEPNFIRSGSSAGLDFAALAKKEQEIIKNMTEEEEEFGRICEDNPGVPESKLQVQKTVEQNYPKDKEPHKFNSSSNGIIGTISEDPVKTLPASRTEKYANGRDPVQAKPEEVKVESFRSVIPTVGEVPSAEPSFAKAKQHVTFSEPRRSPSPELTSKPIVRQGPPTAPKNYVKPEKFFTEPVYENLDRTSLRSDALKPEPPLQKISPPRMRERTPYFVKPRPLSVMELHSKADNNEAVVAKRKPGIDGHRKDIQNHWLIQEAEHRRLFTDNNNRSGPSHWKSMPSVAGIGSAPPPSNRSISAAPQVPLHRAGLETARSSSSLNRDDPHNPSQSRPIRTTIQLPEPRKEAIPALPESIIDTLTRKAAQKSTMREVLQPRPAPQSLRNDYGKGSLPVPHTSQRVNEVQNQERFLSISGRKKCSLCGEELGRGAAMIIESLQLFYHIACFRCTVCGLVLGNGTVGTDVRIRHNRLHCQDCYSTEGLKFSKV